MNKTIDEIINRYKFEYKTNESDDYEAAKDIYHSNFGKVLVSFDKYNFDSRLKELNDYLQTKETKMKANEFKLYQNKINEILEQTKNLEEEIVNENFRYLSLLHNYKKKYDENEDFPEAVNICKNIFKELLNQIFELCIKYEKKFLLINDLIIDINNKLCFLN